MSHFSVLVCLPAGTSLDRDVLDKLLGDTMEPWNENTDVAPYREYEEGAPADHWFPSAMRRAADNLRDGTGLKPYDPGMLGYSSARSNKTHEQQRVDMAQDAKWAERLGDDPTWEMVVKLHNEYDDHEPLLYDAEQDRAYTISTYNPESKWDYWRIGGRWSGYFTAKPGAVVIPTEQHWDSPKDLEATQCDGGKIQDLDLATVRAAAAGEAEIRFGKWEKLSANHPPAKPWSHYRGLAEVGEITWSFAREQYNSQPLVKAATASKLAGYQDCVIEEFTTTAEEYAAEAARAAIPGYALVTLEGEWVAPGRMGWFGMSSDAPSERTKYRVAVNQYLDQVDPATVLVVLDCHT